MYTISCTVYLNIFSHTGSLPCCITGCPEGYIGQKCEAKCNCTNGGFCRADGSCICPSHWRGFDCSIPGIIHILLPMSVETKQLRTYIYIYYTASFGVSCTPGLCYPGVDCYFSANGNITCAPCPKGLAGDGIECYGIHIYFMHIYFMHVMPTL